MATTINSVIEYVKGWRKNNVYTTRGDGSLPEEGFAKFTENLMDTYL